jgi:glutamine synthetase
MTEHTLLTAHGSLTAQGVERVRVIHADPHGRPRSKDFPLSALPGLAAGIGYCEASLVEGLDGEPLMDLPHPGGRGLPDVHAIPDAATARQLPWDPATAWLLADIINLDHQPSGLCARTALRHELDRMATAGYQTVTASEPEFYLLRHTGTGYERYSPSLGMAYTSGRRADPDGIVRRIHDNLSALGLGTTAMHREFSPGQFEININHGDALDATDRVFLFEEAVKELAVMEGLFATFMAKPFANAEGSSHHIHLSLWNEQGNAFADPSGGLSPTGRAFAAGLVAHARAITAIAAPTINSYKRLGGTGLAPTTAAIGGDDRFAYLRIPPQGGDATRVELRIGDASANPYLLTCVALAAGRDGIERGLGEVPPVALPTSLGEALVALEEDEVIHAALGAELVQTIVAVKQRELQRFSQAVTDWEWCEYADHA